MADEQTHPPFNRPNIVPGGLDWATLHRLDGDPLEVQYRHTLAELGKQPGTLVLQPDFVTFMIGGLVAGSGRFWRDAGGVAARRTSAAGAGCLSRA
jgi:hypothetical protein